jgi:glycosyltransferase involved in cell wall biosynthesis
MTEISRRSVCFIAGTLGMGGAERQLYYILKTLSGAGAKLRVLCLTRGEFWEERIRALRVPVEWVGERKSSFVRMARIAKRVSEIRPDVIQSQHFYTNLYATVASRLRGFREVGALRSDAWNEVRSVGGIRGRLCLRTPRVVAANSRRGIENGMRLGIPRSRFILLPNAVEVQQFSVPKRTPGTEVQVLAVGRHGPEKRLDRFLRVVSAAQTRSTVPLRAVIAGDGPLRPSLEEQAARLGLGGKVEFLGAVREMQPVYARSDLLVLTSDWEGTPNVLLEAMAAGLPVVASRVGGVSEIVEDGATGYLVDADNEQAFASAVVALAEQPLLREDLGRRGRHSVETRFSCESLLKALDVLYRRALE